MHLFKIILNLLYTNIEIIFKISNKWLSLALFYIYFTNLVNSWCNKNTCILIFVLICYFEMHE